VNPNKRKRGVQVAAARAKAAALLAAPQTVRLLDKHEVCALTSVTYPTIWAWQRAGAFPRSRIAGGKSVWLSSEIEAWMAALPVRPLKGDSKPDNSKPEPSDQSDQQPWIEWPPAADV
jgi:predicted DNA-binding transcriptional regulator AlpA